MRINHKGFSIVEIVIIVVVVFIIGFAIYGVAKNLNGSTRSITQSNNSTAESSVATDVPSAPQIKTSEDLTTAEKTLDATDPSSSQDKDLKQLDSTLVF